MMGMMTDGWRDRCRWSRLDSETLCGTSQTSHAVLFFHLLASSALPLFHVSSTATQSTGPSTAPTAKTTHLLRRKCLGAEFHTMQRVDGIFYSFLFIFIYLFFIFLYFFSFFFYFFIFYLFLFIFFLLFFLLIFFLFLKSKSKTPATRMNKHADRTRAQTLRSLQPVQHPLTRPPHHLH